MSRGDTWCLKNLEVVRIGHIEAGIRHELRAGPKASTGPCANTLTVELDGGKGVLKGRVSRKQE